MRTSGPFKTRMWWQGPPPGEFRANVFFCFAPLISSRCDEAISPCKSQSCHGLDGTYCVRAHSVLAPSLANTREGSGYEPDGEVLPKAAAVPEGCWSCRQNILLSQAQNLIRNND